MKAHGGEELLPQTLLTSARYEGEWRASRSCHFTLGRGPVISIEHEAEWPLIPVWTFRKTKVSFATVENKTTICYPECFLTF